MKVLSKSIIEEYVYESKEECDNHVNQMLKNGFKIVSDYSGVYEFYRAFTKQNVVLEKIQG